VERKSTKYVYRETKAPAMIPRQEIAETMLGWLDREAVG
jgi:hypothetical protein